MNMLKCPACNKIMIEGIKRCPICNTDSRFFKKTNTEITNEAVSVNPKMATVKESTIIQANDKISEKEKYEKEKDIDLFNKSIKFAVSVFRTAIEIIIIIVVFSILFGSPNNKINKAINKLGEELGISGSDNGSVETAVFRSDD